LPNLSPDRDFGEDATQQNQAKTIVGTSNNLVSLGAHYPDAVRTANTIIEAFLSAYQQDGPDKVPDVPKVPKVR
jgi:hypothetical protein